MTAQRILDDLMSVLGGIQEDQANYRNVREALALTRSLAVALEVTA